MDERTAVSRHPDSIGQVVQWALLPTLLLVLNIPVATYAQVVTNIAPTTIAPLDLGTNVDTVGSTTHITGGTRPGSGTNLFHSFDAFRLGTGDTAHFLNDMQLPTTNIFGRVIGGEVSTIDGTLRTNNPLNAVDPMNFGAANLWLVNPSGLLLGPNARIEVGGSVSMSTANYLRFEGTVALFDMLSSPVSLGPLSVAPVVAFGFLGPEPPAPMTVQGSMLQVPEGQSLSLVGGDITVQGATLVDDTIQAASLRAPGGQLDMVTVASPGEVLVPSFQTGPNINGASFTTMGTVTLKEGATLDVSGQLDEFGVPIGNGNSGTVLVRGGQLVMDGSFIQGNTLSSVDGAPTAVDVQVSHDVALSNGAAIITTTSGPGLGGDVHLTAGRLTLENGSGIVTESLFGDGAGGDLILNVGKLRLLGGPFGGSLIRSTNFNDGTDQGSVGGNVTVQANSVVLSGGSQVVSETVINGDGGGISITAKSLDLDEVSTINSATFGTGVGGDIFVGVRQVRLVDGATITSQTFSADPDAGVGGTVTVQGLAGPGSKASSVVLSGPNTRIVSDSASGVPGDLTVYAGTLTITNGAAIAVGSPASTGPAGEVTVSADSIVISAGGQIFSRSFTQDAGPVTITANALTLDNGSIGTSTSSEIGGRGGDVVVHGGTVSLTNGASITSQSEAFSTGQGGDITMTVGSLTLANQSVITSSNKGFVADAGDAGNISIQSGSTVVLSNSSITTEAGEGSGGQIEINAPEMVRLINSQISTSVAGSDVDTAGGNITIDPQFVILQNSQILSQANAGAGGAILVTAGFFLMDPASVLSASSRNGVLVEFESPLSKVTAHLSQQFSSAAALLLAERCAADSTGQFSSFVQTGRDGVPQIPGALSPSPLSFLEPLTSGSLGSPSPNGAAARLGLDSVRYDDSTRFLSACRS